MTLRRHTWRQLYYGHLWTLTVTRSSNLHLGDVSLDAGMRDIEFLLAGTRGVFETREEIGDGIGENCHNLGRLNVRGWDSD